MLHIRSVEQLFENAISYNNINDFCYVILKIFNNMNSCVKMAHKFEYFHRQHENRNFLENPLHFHARCITSQGYQSYLH